MWEHTRDHHDGVVGDKKGMQDYNVRLTNKFKRCLERQVDEDIRMQHCELKGGTVLSRKEVHVVSKFCTSRQKCWHNLP